MVCSNESNLLIQSSDKLFQTWHPLVFFHFLPLSPSMSLRLYFLGTLSLWIIIAYHTGLITASERVSMKTLITVRSGALCFDSLSHLHEKKTAAKNQKENPIHRLFFNKKFLLFLNMVKIQQWTTTEVWPIWIGSCFWGLFMFFCLLQKHSALLLWLLSLLFPRGKFYSHNMTSFKCLKAVCGHFCLGKDIGWLSDRIQVKILISSEFMGANAECVVRGSGADLSSRGVFSLVCQNHTLLNSPLKSLVKMVTELKLTVKKKKKKRPEEKMWFLFLFFSFKYIKKKYQNKLK